jgi:hypothetical protein
MDKTEKVIVVIRGEFDLYPETLDTGYEEGLLRYYIALKNKAASVQSDVMSCEELVRGLSNIHIDMRLSSIVCEIDL